MADARMERIKRGLGLGPLLGHTKDRDMLEIMQQMMDRIIVLEYEVERLKKGGKNK